jgi:protein FAM32A
VSFLILFRLTTFAFSTKRRRKKSKPKGEKSSTKDEARDESPSLALPSGNGSGRDSPTASGSSADRKTAAEKRFQEVQRQRVGNPSISLIHPFPDLIVISQLAERVKKLANKTHKDRVHEFNAKLESLSEHHDIPKVFRCCVIILGHQDSYASVSGWTRIIFRIIRRTVQSMSPCLRVWHSSAMSCHHNRCSGFIFALYAAGGIAGRDDVACLVITVCLGVLL